MAKYNTKSVLIGRKKKYEDDADVRPCFVSLFNENNPHKSGEVPFEILDFEKMHKVSIENLKVHYLLPGNDLVINDLEYIELKIDGTDLILTGRQFNKTSKR